MSGLLNRGPAVELMAARKARACIAGAGKTANEAAGVRVDDVRIGHLAWARRGESGLLAERRLHAFDEQKMATHGTCVLRILADYL